MEKDSRAVLRAYVGTLPVQSRGIVGRPERLEQLVITDLCRIICDLHYFGVPGFVGAHILITRILCLTAEIAHFSFRHARKLPKRFLYSPKTSSAECCFFHNCSCVN